MWVCKCDCGNIVIVTGADLRNHKTQSCGCYAINYNQRNKTKDLTHTKYGLLTPKYIVKYEDHQVYWYCECDCGGSTIATRNNLSNGSIKSCGCLHSSYGVKYIIGYLHQHGIKYETEITFEDLRSPHTNKKLRYDFGIYTNDNQLVGLIEFNGRQHYTSIPMWGGTDYFNKLQFYDNIKINYSRENQIPLLIIKYDDDYDIKLNDFFMNGLEA